MKNFGETNDKPKADGAVDESAVSPKALGDCDVKSGATADIADENAGDMSQCEYSPRSDGDAADEIVEAADSLDGAVDIDANATQSSAIAVVSKEGGSSDSAAADDAQPSDVAANADDGASGKKPSIWRSLWQWIKNTMPGVLLCALIAVPSWLLGKLVPVIGSAVFAILFGMIIAFFKRPKILEKGIKFTSKKVLQASIVFLGFGMDFYTVLEVGGDSLLIILSTITTSLVVAFVMSKLLKIPSDVATLVGVGSSICGGSAIAATAPVIKAKDSDVATSISVIFLFNVIAAFTFPALGQAMGMSDTGFGMWAGTAINDTSSVVAAGQSWSSMTGSDTALQYATIVKLTRTLAIIPITLVLAVAAGIKAKRSAAAQGTGVKFDFVKIFPWFVIFFLIAAIVNTWLFPAVGIGESVSDFLNDAGKFMIALAMAAIGLNTNIVKLIRTGWKPILLGLCCWIAIAAVSIGVQIAMGLW